MHIGVWILLGLSYLLLGLLFAWTARLSSTDSWEKKIVPLFIPFWGILLPIFIVVCMIRMVFTALKEVFSKKEVKE